MNQNSAQDQFETRACWICRDGLHVNLSSIHSTLNVCFIFETQIYTCRVILAHFRLVTSHLAVNCNTISCIKACKKEKLLIFYLAFTSKPTYQK